MPSYLITDNQTGRKYKVTGDTPPTESEAAMIFQRMDGGKRAPTNNPADYPQGKTVADQDAMRREFLQQEKGNKSIKEKVEPYLPSRQTLATLSRPILEGGGAVAGGILGAGGGTLATPGLGTLAGGVAGAGLGYAMGKNVADTIAGDYAQTPTEAVTRSLKDIGTGATYEMGGQAVVPVAKVAAKGLGYVAKPVLSKLSGVGPGAIDEAIQSGVNSKLTANPLKSQNAFDNALRGNVAGDDIVDSAKSALNSLKEQRATAYQSQLAGIAQNTRPIDLRPLKMDLVGMMNKYNVKVDPTTGAIDTSRIAMGKTGRKDIADIIETVSAWGSQKGDNTAQGLDVLKRQLDDFYSDSSQARQFVTAIRNKVKDTIVTNVPQYDEMTKGYSEATKLIKDVEADLMLRKQGMSGRTTADKTLRRLMSAMRDNFEMRRELVGILGKEGGEDLTGQIAGYTMNTPVPRGLAGTGPLLAGQAAYAHFINPAFWPVLAASSPRVQGEFLRMLGKGIGAAKAIPQTAIKTGAMQTAVTADDIRKQQDQGAQL